jgi:hypothetical protein
MSKPTDEQLRQAIDAIFNKYRTGESGTLGYTEMKALFKGAFESLDRK